MTLLTTVNQVCAVIGVHKLTSVFSGIDGNRTAFELLALANEMAQRIAGDARDWTMLRLTQTYNGDGTKEAFDLPANYKRMLSTSNVWRSTYTQAPMRFIPDTDEWLQRRRVNYYNAPHGEWTIYGGQMHIWPIMAVGVTASFPYLDRNCVALASGGNGFEFMADGDLFRLSERLLRLGMIWQWKANKGSPYAEDMASFEDAMSVAMGSDSPAPIIVGNIPASGNVAYPGPTPSSSDWRWPFP
jgi:hypothetical protein